MKKAVIGIVALVMILSIVLVSCVVEEGSLETGEEGLVASGEEESVDYVLVKNCYDLRYWHTSD